MLDVQHKDTSALRVCQCFLASKSVKACVGHLDKGMPFRLTKQLDAYSSSILNHLVCCTPTHYTPI